MKITSFDPIIASPKADDVIKVFEALGFEKTHAPVTATEIGNVPSVRMKNADGFHVDVADLNIVQRDNVMIRMNVDNFEEAYGILTAHGFTNTNGNTPRFSCG